jgi:uncharacterized membrane protein YbhN (UPF0104 family)
MNFFDVLFISQFIILLLLAGAKLFNLLNKTEKFNIKWSFIILIGIVICYFVGFQVVLFTEYVSKLDLIYVQLFRLEMLLLLLSIIFFIVEVIMTIKVSLPKEIQPNMSLQRR